MKKLFVICLSLIMVLSSFSFCFADQTFYIDPSTGSVVNDPNSASSAISGEVALSSDCRYDKSSKVYIYPTEAINGACVRANVYNGMVVTSPVIISVDSGAMVSVYLEGEPISEDTYGNITELGVYIVRDESADREMFRFTIVNKITGALSSYNVPDIFYISSVNFNGANLTQVGNEVKLAEDGLYKISYANDSISKKYTLELTIDHTAPILQISGINEKGIANSTVRFGELEPNSSLAISRNGENIVKSTELKEAGDYVVVYADEAGNAVTYTFTIHFFLDVGGWLYVALIALVAGGAVFYYFYSKKRLQVS